MYFYIPSPEEIRRYRISLGLTQSELARRAKVSQSLIARIESGEIDPRVSTLKKILNCLRNEEFKIKKKESIKAHEIMTSPVIYVEPSDTVLKASKLMEKYKISQLPVIKNDIQVGTITDDTLLKVFLREKNPNVISKLKVEKIMEEPFPMVNKSTDMDVIYKLLQNFRAVLVLDKGKIIGIITKSDLIKLFK